MKFFLIFLTFLVIDCSDNGNQEIDREVLEKLEKEIRTMIDDSVCSDEFTCNYIGFGSKPCGGNWEYLVYSNSIDVSDFLSKVKRYNDLEKKYNTKYGIMSDCMVVSPPTELVCENGKCKAIYN